MPKTNATELHNSIDTLEIAIRYHSELDQASIIEAIKKAKGILLEVLDHPIILSSQKIVLYQQQVEDLIIAGFKSDQQIKKTSSILKDIVWWTNLVQHPTQEVVLRLVKSSIDDLRTSTLHKIPKVTSNHRVFRNAIEKYETGLEVCSNDLLLSLLQLYDKVYNFTYGTEDTKELKIPIIELFNQILQDLPKEYLSH